MKYNRFFIRFLLVFSLYLAINLECISQQITTPTNVIFGISIDDSTFMRNDSIDIDRESWNNNLSDSEERSEWIVLLKKETEESTRITSGINNPSSANLPKELESTLSPIFKAPTQSTNFLLNSLASKKTSTQQISNRLSRYYKTSDHATIDYLITNGLAEHIERNHTYTIEQSEVLDVGERPWYFSIMEIEEAWLAGSGDGIEVAVLDTGLEWDHDEMQNRVAINSLEDRNNNGLFDPWPSDSVVDGISGDLDGIDNDGNGYADDVIGYDFVDLKAFDLGDAFAPDPIPMDEHGHGTAMASLIAANADGKGMTGVAPLSQIVSIRSFDSRGNGESDDIANGILYAIARKVKIINMSFGDSFESVLVRDAIRLAEAEGILMISSAGNSSSYFGAYPSDYPEVISVSGINKEGERYGRSNFGSMIDLSAPAVELPSAGLNNGYRLSTGTSGAAALVSGIAALGLSANGSLSSDELKSMLFSSTDDYGEVGWDSIFGNGLVNARKAVRNDRDSRLSFLSPLYGETFRMGEVLLVKADILSPLFKSWELTASPGWGVKSGTDEIIWTSLSTGTTSGINKLIATVNTNILSEGLNTLRLRVSQKNGIALEKRIYINIESSDEKLEFMTTKVYDAFSEGQPSKLVYIETNEPSEIAASVIEDITGYRYFAKGTANLTSHHLFDIKTPRLKEDFELWATAYNGFDTIRESILFSSGHKTFQQNIFTEKSYSLPFSYIEGKPYQIEGSTYIAATDFTSLVFGRTTIYRFDGQDFVEEWGTDNSWVIKAAGDIDGDGIPEILGTIDRGATIFSHSGSGNPFDNPVYSTNSTDIIWGIDFADMDSDGDQEAILIGKTANIGFGQEDILRIVDFIDGEFREFDFSLRKLADKDGDGAKETLVPQNDLQNDAAILDLNGNGNKEIVVSDFKGIVTVYTVPYPVSKENDYTLDPIYQSELAISSSNHYFTAGDFDNDNTMEVAIMGFGQSGFNTERETPGHEAGSVRLLSFDGEFNLSDPMFFRNSRNNLGLHWGISSGDIHERPGDELIINSFPYVYIFGAGDTLEPIYSAYGILSRSTINGDFDNNGRTEFIINSFDKAYVFERSEESINTPVVNRLHLIDESTAWLEWYPTPEGRYYVGAVENGEIRILAETNNTTISIGELEPDTEYIFTVASIGNTGNSLFSPPLSVYTAPPTEPITAEKLSDKLYQIRYSGYLPRFLSHDDVYVRDEFSNFYYPTYGYSDSDSLLTLFFKNELPTGKLTFISTSFYDNRGLQAKRKEIQLDNIDNEVDNEYFTLVSAELIGNGNLITLVFSDAITDQEKIDAAKYSVSPIGELFTPGSSFGDPNILQINVSSDVKTRGKGIEYCIEIEGLVSDKGLPISENPGNRACFTIPVENLNDVYAFPQPWEAANGSSLIFSNITSEATVEIMDISGNIIASVKERDNNGGVEWDGWLNNGKKITPGVYFYRVSSPGEDNTTLESGLMKFAVTE